MPEACGAVGLGDVLSTAALDMARQYGDRIPIPYVPDPSRSLWSAGVALGLAARRLPGERAAAHFPPMRSVTPPTDLCACGNRYHVDVLIYYGLWYPVTVATVTAVVGFFFVKEMRGAPIEAWPPRRPRSARSGERAKKRSLRDEFRRRRARASDVPGRPRSPWAGFPGAWRAIGPAASWFGGSAA